MRKKDYQETPNWEQVRLALVKRHEEFISAEEHTDEQIYLLEKGRTYLIDLVNLAENFWVVNEEISCFLTDVAHMITCHPMYMNDVSRLIHVICDSEQNMNKAHMKIFEFSLIKKKIELKDLVAFVAATGIHVEVQRGPFNEAHKPAFSDCWSSWEQGELTYTIDEDGITIICDGKEGY